MSAVFETTPFGDAVLKTGVLSVVLATLLGLGTLIYYALGYSSAPSALTFMRAGSWSEEVKTSIQTTYLYLFASFYICIISAGIVFADETLFFAFSSFTMVILDFVVETLVQSGKFFCQLSSQGLFSNQRIAWVLYCSFLGGITSSSFLLGAEGVRLSFHVTCILMAALLVISMMAPVGKYAAWHDSLNVFEFLVLVSSIGTAFFPVSTSSGALFFSTSFYGGLVLFPLCFLCHSQEAQMMAYQATAENPYCAIGMSVPMLLDSISIFTRIVVLVPPK